MSSGNWGVPPFVVDASESVDISHTSSNSPANSGSDSRIPGSDGSANSGRSNKVIQLACIVRDLASVVRNHHAALMEMSSTTKLPGEKATSCIVGDIGNLAIQMTAQANDHRERMSYLKLGEDQTPQTTICEPKSVRHQCPSNAWPNHEYLNKLHVAKVSGHCYTCGERGYQKKRCPRTRKGSTSSTTKLTGYGKSGEDSSLVLTIEDYEQPKRATPHTRQDHQPPSMQQSKAMRNICYACGNSGHHRKECNQTVEPHKRSEQPYSVMRATPVSHNPSSRRPNPPGGVCYGCGEAGHRRRNCKQPVSGRNVSLTKGQPNGE